MSCGTQCRNMANKWWLIFAAFPSLMISSEWVRHVTVPDVYAATGDDAVIKCYIKFAENEYTTEGDVIFELLNMNMKCYITKWRKCLPVCLEHGVKPANFSCGCLSRADQTRFIFYLYLQACHKELDRTHFECTIASDNPLSSNGQLKLIDFSTKPEIKVRKCIEENVQFPWEYNPKDFQEHFVIHHISWKFYPVVGQPSIVGRIYDSPANRSQNMHFGERALIYQVALKETIPRLMVKSVKTADEGVFEIEITFLSQNALRSYKEVKQMKLTQVTVSKDVSNESDTEDAFDHPVLDDTLVYYDDTSNEKQKELNVQSKEMFENNVENNTNFCMKNKKVNEKEDVAVTLTDFIDTFEPILRSSVILHITDPPRDNFSLMFKVLSRKDELFVYCTCISYNIAMTFEYMSFLIKNNDVVLGVSENESSLLLKVDKEATMTNYTCELVGEAVRCQLNESANRTKIITKLMNSHVPTMSMDLTFTTMDVIFTLEGVLCIFFMMWSFRLFIWHVSFLCSRKALQEERKLSTFLDTVAELKMDRISQHTLRLSISEMNLSETNPARFTSFSTEV